jgi:4-oxalomesaconate hydratase
MSALHERAAERRRLLVVSAHTADFVWRAAGAIARTTTAGGQALVVALSYGERGESGELWKQPGQTVETVKTIRHREATEAAEILGAALRCLDLGDYPLEVGTAALESLIAVIREFRPDAIVTHAERDPFNPDHPAAYVATTRARMLAVGAGVASAFETVAPSQLFVFEPHQPELCGFVPDTFVDITDVYPLKEQAMRAVAAQEYLRQYYAERARHRANHARRICGNANLQYAEAFQRILPQVVTTL